MGVYKFAAPSFAGMPARAGHELRQFLNAIENRCVRMFEATRHFVTGSVPYWCGRVRRATECGTYKLARIAAHVVAWLFIVLGPDFSPSQGGAFCVLPGLVKIGFLISQYVWGLFSSRRQGMQDLQPALPGGGSIDS